MINQEYTKTKLYVEYVTGFGDRTQVEIDLQDETADSFLEGVRRVMLAIGYQPETVQEVLPTEFDLMNREEESHNLEKYYDGEKSDHMTSDNDGSNDREF